ncbi:hypothetical protein ElyMa_000880000 [Elysia marginata]|uniref:ZAD domain-containing protein n=1 Tax=Elysia marginata TaxID=1093978 RepID=A0AAV4H896_9GAST|nr:hypothetical protein ElyMa_000880000 [Elysia marginata]
MEHNFDSHQMRLKELCRLCGLRNLTSADKKKRRKPILCSDHTRDILLIFDVHIERDTDIYPPSMCFACFSSMRNYKRRSTHEALSKARMRVSAIERMWSECDTRASEDDCAVCKQYLNTSNGARFSKKKHKKALTSPPSPRSNSHIDRTGCSSTQTSTDATHVNTSHSPAQVDISTDTACTVETLEDDCDLPSFSAVGTLDKHTSTPPKDRPANTTNESATHLTPTLTKQSAPLLEPTQSPDIKTLFKRRGTQIHKIHKKKATQSENNIIDCKKGGGQPISMMKITNCRKPSTEASTSSRRERSQQIETTRTSIAGTSKQAQQTQHTHELNRLTKPVRREVFKDAGLESSVYIDEQTSLAMRVNVGLT